MRGQFTKTHHFAEEVSNADPIIDIISDANLSSDKWLYIRSGIICVLDPAQGSGGRLRLRRTDGNQILLDMNVDAIKEVPFDFGDPGLLVDSRGKGLQVLVYGAGSSQATVFISLIATISRRSE